MPQCPKCSAELKDDYGMVSCAQCGSIVFIDMDGIAHIGEETPREPTAIGILSGPTDEGSVDDLSTPMPSIDDPAPIEDFSSQTPSDFAASEAVPFSPEPAADQASDSNDELTPDLAQPEQDGELDMDAMLGYQSSEPSSPTSGQFDQPGPPGDPLGLSEYANSEISQAKDGLLTFRILISGIDTKEMRESLREAMEDARFAWDPSAIMARISKGSLEIENVSPVKATILINRIKRLPLKIRWEQHAITQIDQT